MGQRESTVTPAVPPPRTDLPVKKLVGEKGVTYEGQVNEKNEKHGYGKLVAPNKLEIVGQFQDGKVHGFAKMTHVNGTTYEGEYKYGKYDGRGVLKYPNWQVYKGHFKGGIREGHGVFYNSDGTPRHSGTYKNDKMTYCCGLC